MPAFMVRGGDTYRLVTDHLGSVRMVVDVATGDVAEERQYDEWGGVLADTNPGFVPFGFAGGLYDVDTGLVRFGARDYDAEVGRWVAKEPLGIRSVTNLFQYGGSDPINMIDPTGLYAEISLDGDTVRVRLPILFTGPAWSQEAQDAAIAAIEHYWNRSIRTSTWGDSDAYNVVVEVDALTSGIRPASTVLADL